MKYNVGDLVLVKNIDPHLGVPPHRRLRLRLLLRPRPRLRLDLELDYYLHLKNTYGVITEVISHNDAWQRDSTEEHNVYFWYSQVDAKTYWFCENEITEYEVAK